MRTTPKYFLILAVMAGAAVVSASCASDGPSTAPVSENNRIVQTNLRRRRDVVPAVDVSCERRVEERRMRAVGAGEARNRA